MLNLAAVLEDVGERDEARARLEKALEILERTLGKNDPVVASVLLRLGESYLNARQFDRARAVLERARGILEAQPVLPHSRLGRMLNVLGRLMNDSGDPGAAIPLYDAAQAAIAEELGAAHPLAAENLRDRAVARRSVGDEAGSLDDALAAERIARAGLLEFSRFLSEREALRYLEVRTKGLDLALSLLTAEKGSVGDAVRVQKVWNEVVQSRAVVLDELAFRHRAALESGSPGISALASDLEAARRRLFRLMRTDTESQESETDRVRLDSARRDVERAERALAADSALFREVQAHNEVALADVVRALPPGIALLAYVRYERQPTPSTPAGSGGSVPSYLAFVATGGSTPAQVVSLGPARNIEDRVREWRQEVSTAPLDLAAMARYRRAGERLSEAIWQPVASRLGTARIVLVVPDGEISFVSFATLPVGAEKYLVERGPLLQYLSAERDLSADPERMGEGVGLLVVGGPDYDAPPAKGSIPLSRPGSAGAPGAAPSQQASQTGLAASGRCRDLAALRFDPLPSALEEAGEVAKRWRRESGRKPAGADSPRPAVSTLAGATATEAAFKAGAPGRSVLHLATHGFFVPARCGATLEDSLLAAGLAMAGANRRDDAALPVGADDGLLTAEEIASLDLRSVRWAVLSACDTGLGQVHAGEGVLGLRRAFQIAGVDTLIMSLWAVEDHSAREWVRKLYRFRGEGLSTVEAMSRADRSAIDERRKAGIVTHPFYWGAFVAAGDWR
jgi:CHAT domain-containing protein